MTVRDELHKILDRVPETDVATALEFLRSLVDPVELSLLSAPIDDEPEPKQSRKRSSEPGVSQAVERLTNKCFASLACEPVPLDRSC